MWHSKSVKERDVTVHVRQRSQCMTHTKETVPQSGFASVFLKVVSWNTVSMKPKLRSKLNKRTISCESDPP